MIAGIGKVLESAIAIRTLNTQTERLEENLSNIDFISKFAGENPKLKDALDDCCNKYNLEMITNLNKMYAEIEHLMGQLACAQEEIKAFKNQLKIDSDFD